MDKNGRRRSRNGRHHNWAENKNKNDTKQNPVQHRPVVNPAVFQSMQIQEKAIREFKAREVICSMCGKPITELSSALSDKATGAPVHFDCVLEAVSRNEHLKENEKVTYIGQGRFAVLLFENPRDLRHFKIERTIEWEEADKRLEWRSEIAGLYSQIK